MYTTPVDADASRPNLDDRLPVQDEPTGGTVDHVPPLLEFDFDDGELEEEGALDVRSDDITIYT